jgi:hypothetical protein
MSNNENRYEVKEEVTNTNPLGSLSGFFGGAMNATTVTVTDTLTGEEYSATNYDASKAHEDVRDQVKSSNK